MSYDIYLNGSPCDKCGHCPSGPELPNPTYNLSQIFDLALTGEKFPNQNINEMEVVVLHKQTDRPRGLRVLSGKRASDTEAIISTALGRMNDPTMLSDFQALAPENGWGDLPGAIEIMGKLLEAAREYPEHVWEIH